MTDLLPCPFCNSRVTESGRSSRLGEFLQCISCGCSAPVSTWNRRTPSADAVPREPTMEMIYAAVAAYRFKPEGSAQERMASALRVAFAAARKEGA